MHVNRFKLSVQQVRNNLEAEALRDVGIINERIQARIDREVQQYANEKAEYKRRLKGGDFNPLTSDPNCKNCGKKKKNSLKKQEK